jgi:hypothetical protein
LGDLILGDLVPSDRWNDQFLEIHDPATKFLMDQMIHQKRCYKWKIPQKIEEPSYKKLLEHLHHGFIFPEYGECQNGHP